MFDVQKTINESIDIKSKLIDFCLEDIIRAGKLMAKSINSGGKIIWCGNGGSAADAQHMAAELMGGLVSHDRKPIPSIALTTDTSFITAWSNDTDFSTIFSRQIEGIGNENDVLMSISTSGNSPNVVKAIKSAVGLKIKNIIITGKNGGEMRDLGDISICVPSNNTQRIQESHLLIEHILCEYLESLFLNS